ncbi:MAG: sulfotransferase [Porticoccaceae bacterium]
MSKAHFLLWIGGSGGSGTRALAAVLTRAGLSPGTVLNEALDSLPMAALYDRHLAAYVSGQGFDAARWRLELTAALDRHIDGQPSPWLVKNPRAVLALPALLDGVPGSRFLLLVRNGIDMAFSANQRQLGLYGDLLLGPAAAGESPAGRALRLWAAVNLRARDIVDRHPGRCATLRYEDLCAQPVAAIARIGGELGIPLAREHFECEDIMPASRTRPADWREQLGAALAQAAPALTAFGYPC